MQQVSLTLPTYLFRGGLKGERSIREIASICKDGCVQELSANFTEQGEISLQSDFSQLEILKKDLDGMGVCINNITTLLTNGISYLTAGLEEQKRYHQIVKKMLDICRVLEIGTLSMHISTSRVLSSYSYEEAVRLEGERVQELSEICRQAGVQLLLENVMDGLISTGEGYREFLKHYAPRAGLCYDIANSYFVCPPEHWFEILGPSIRYIHLTDIRIKSLRGMLLEFVDPGEGQINYSSVIERIESTGYQGPVLIESFEKRGQDDSKRVAELVRWWEKKGVHES